MARKLFLVCYDIVDDRTRTRALRLTRKYASGGQKSVHECWLNASETMRVLSELDGVIDENLDRVLVLRLDPRRETICLGTAAPPLDDCLMVIGHDHPGH